MSLFITVKKIEPHALLGTQVSISPKNKYKEKEIEQQQEIEKTALLVAQELQKFRAWQEKEIQRAQHIERESRAEKLRSDPNAMQIEEYVEVLLKGRSSDCIEIFEREITVDKDQFSNEEWDDLNRFCEERGILVWENCLQDF